MAIAEWQTDVGFVDYALFVGTKMVATIEAKASYKDVSAVIDCQCKDYSRNIKSGICFLDLRKPNNAPKALRG